MCKTRGTRAAFTRISQFLSSPHPSELQLLTSYTPLTSLPFPTHNFYLYIFLNFIHSSVARIPVFCASLRVVRSCKTNERNDMTHSACIVHFIYWEFNFNCVDENNTREQICTDNVSSAIVIQKKNSHLEYVEKTYELHKGIYTDLPRNEIQRFV